MGGNTSVAEVESQLERLLPATLDDAGLNAAFDPVARALLGMTHREYAGALAFLSRRLGDYHPGDGRTQFFFDPQDDVRGNTIDAYANFAVTNYAQHVPMHEIAAHLLMRLRRPPGNALRQLVHLMTWRSRRHLFDWVVRQDAASEDGLDLVDDFEETLERLCMGTRPGFVDTKLTALIDELADVTPTKERPATTLAFEQRILATLRERRRMRKLIKPPIDGVLRARWAAEEADREIRVYPVPDLDRIVDLCLGVYNWWYPSKAHLKVSGRPQFLEIGSFFDELLATARRIRLGGRIEELWEARVRLFLRDDRFWHNIAGLGGEAGVAFENTEAAARDAAYRRGALVSGAIYAGVVLLPLVAIVVIRAPGAAAALVRWAGTRLLLTTQYVASTVRVYGAIGGGAAMARDAYRFYLANPVKVNEVVVQGTELVLDLFAGESGATPGSSPADLLTSATDDAARLAAKGLRAAEREIEFVDVAVQQPDGVARRIVGRIESGAATKLRVAVLEVHSASTSPGRQEIRFLGPVAADEDTLDVARLATTTASKSASLGTLLTTPRKTVLRGVEAKSWHPSALVGTSQDQMRDRALAIIRAPNDRGTPHELAGVLENNRFVNGGHAEQWEKDARILDAAHVRSKSGGGPDVLVLMSANYNRGKNAADLEHAANPGVVILDEVYVIGDIAIHKPTARDLVTQGYLRQSALDDAKTLDLSTLDFHPAPLPSRVGDRKVARPAGGAPARPTAPGTTRGELFDVATDVKIGKLRVRSWHPTTLIGTSQSQMRNASLRIIVAGGDKHPLARIPVGGRLLSGGEKQVWASDARYLVAAHALSKKADEEHQLVVFMSAHYNSRFSTDLERMGTPGAVALDEVYDVGGIAIHKLTLEDLVSQGWVEAEVLRHARTIDLRSLRL